MKRRYKILLFFVLNIVFMLLLVEHTAQLLTALKVYKKELFIHCIKKHLGQLLR